MSNRNEKIYKERLAGLTFREIANRYGISIERARQIYLREERLREFKRLKHRQGDYETIKSLNRAITHIKTARSWRREELTQADRDLIEKMRSLISVYSD